MTDQKDIQSELPEDLETTEEDAENVKGGVLAPGFFGGGGVGGGSERKHRKHRK